MQHGSLGFSFRFQLARTCSLRPSRARTWVLTVWGFSSTLGELLSFRYAKRRGQMSLSVDLIFSEEIFWRPLQNPSGETSLCHGVPPCGCSFSLWSWVRCEGADSRNRAGVSKPRHLGPMSTPSEPSAWPWLLSLGLSFPTYKTRVWPRPLRSFLALIFCESRSSREGRPIRILVLFLTLLWFTRWPWVSSSSMLHVSHPRTFYITLEGYTKDDTEQGFLRVRFTTEYPGH